MTTDSKSSMDKAIELGRQYDKGTAPGLTVDRSPFHFTDPVEVEYHKVDRPYAMHRIREGYRFTYHNVRRSPDVAGAYFDVSKCVVTWEQVND